MDSNKYELNRSNHVPLYYQIKEVIDNMIQEGIWTSGDKIPSENELKEKFDVSRTTIRLAINELVSEGKLKKKQGLGTFVSKPKIEHPLSVLNSFTNEIRNKGLEAGSKLINLERVIPPNKVKEKLNLKENEKCILLERVRLINDEKVGIHFAYLNSSLLEKYPFEDFDFDNKSLYEIIEKNYEIKISRALETIEAAPADKYQSDLLEIESGFPMIVLERLTFTEEDIPLEFVEIYYRFDKYKYNIKLKK